MATQSPFSFLDGLFERIAAGPQPPAWLVHELQHRLVLFLNHVLMQEPEAQARLARQQGRVVKLQWGDFWMQLAVTPAGLCERAPAAEPDLLLTVTDATPLGLLKDALRGDKPGVRIEGDVQLAAEVSWLIDHVRWDAEEDLSRLVGDAPAHTLAGIGRAMAQALRQLAARLPGAGKAAHS